jgi:hypothetical protein
MGIVLYGYFIGLVFYLTHLRSCSLFCLAVDRLTKIPSERDWLPLDRLCPTLDCGHCPRENLVDVEGAVDTAVRYVADLINEHERVPPIVISRVYRGGKSTLIDLISKKLSESR